MHDHRDGRRGSAARHVGPRRDLRTGRPDSIDGKGGDDLIFAGAGQDLATGGLGRDRIVGDAGSDFCLSAIDDHPGDRVFGGSGSDTADRDDGDHVHAVERILDFFCFAE